MHVSRLPTEGGPDEDLPPLCLACMHHGSVIVVAQGHSGFKNPSPPAFYGSGAVGDGPRLSSYCTPPFPPCRVPLRMRRWPDGVVTVQVVTVLLQAAAVRQAFRMAMGPHRVAGAALLQRLPLPAGRRPPVRRQRPAGRHRAQGPALSPLRPRRRGRVKVVGGTSSSPRPTTPRWTARLPWGRGSRPSTGRSRPPSGPCRTAWTRSLGAWWVQRPPISP